MKIFAVVMIRNEIDIVEGFLSHHNQLLDGMIIADMQSSDGTAEVIESFAAHEGKIKRIVLPYLVKYQAEVLTTLSKIAFQKGADWVFFLDGDEFLYVESRQELEHRLGIYGGEIMHLPWINLVPREFGTFSHFNLSQEFCWSGRLSTFKKVAVSRNYAERYPDYAVCAGNHNVKRDIAEPEEELRIGFPLLHLPIRSVERARYKALNALDLQSRKHNQLRGEGAHHARIKSELDGKMVSDEVLAGLSYDYGSANFGAFDPRQADFPTISIPFSDRNSVAKPANEVNPVNLRLLDKEKTWQVVNGPKDAKVFAQVANGTIQLLPQPQLGDQAAGPQRFARMLENVGQEGAGDIIFEDLVGGLRLSLMPPPVNVFSAWTNLVPSLGILFSFLKPRRYVELGVHNGMSFFAACEYSKSLSLGTECVAIDSWEGDPHAGIHDTSVFESFQKNLREKYSDQIFIKSYFDESSKLFEDGSIDLLHVDGFHSYDAVKHDFEMWVDKLSSRGVMIFHDTNVHERDFGVWRFWAEVSKKYPHIELYHGHGLGILYVGEPGNPVARLFQLASENKNHLRLATYFLEFQSDQAAGLRKKAAASQRSAAGLSRNTINMNDVNESAISLAAELNYTKVQLDSRTEALNLVLKSKTWQLTKAFRRWSNSLRKLRGKSKKIWPKPIE